MGIDWEGMFGEDYMDAYEDSIWEATQYLESRDGDDDDYVHDQSKADSDSNEYVRTYLCAVDPNTGEQIKLVSKFAGHEFTQEEINILVSGGLVEGFVSEDDQKVLSRAFRLTTASFKGKTYPQYQIVFNSTVFKDHGIEYVSYMSGKNWLKFKRVWGGHRFTTDEAFRLVSGESITFSYVARSNVQYEATGRLGNYTYNNKEYYGFVRDDAPQS